MDEIVLTAQCTRKPTAPMSEQEGPVKGKGQTAIDGHLTSSVFPQFIQDMPYHNEGNPALGDAIAREATDRGVVTLAHHPDSLEPDCRILVPMRFKSRAHEMVRPTSSIPFKRRP